MNGIVQVAGVLDQSEAAMLEEAGVDLLGIPLRLPDGREDISEPEARKIAEGLKRHTTPVLITYISDAAEIGEFCGYLGVSVVQLHGNIETAELKKLAALYPDLYIIKSLVVGENAFADLGADQKRTHPYVDAFITDTFDAATGRRGATGMTHDWELSRKLVTMSSRYVILAGGLNADNVRGAIQKVKPAGVDAHTGLEDSRGRKDPDKVRLFVTRAREAFRELSEPTVSTE